MARYRVQWACLGAIMVSPSSKRRVQSERLFDAQESRESCSSHSSRNRPMSALSKRNGSKTGKIRKHDFTLVLSGITELTPEVQDALFEAGCDDATLSMCCGRPFLTFTRAA